MLLAIDIGNTDIKIGLFKGEKAFCNWRLAADKGATLKQYKKLLRRLFAGPACPAIFGAGRQKVKNAGIDEIIICSVVPNLTKIFKKALLLLLKVKPLILGKDIVAPIKNLYKRPEQVGQDRLANAAAAFSKYGGPVIVVDFGTALTFDLVTAQGSYLGGVIAPGMEASLKALTRDADLLPEISLGRPRALLGRETASSMRSGLVYGYSFLVEGMLQQLKKELKSRPYIVATGGKASLMSHYCRSIDRIDENLTLEGLLKTALQGRKQTKRVKK